MKIAGIEISIYRGVLSRRSEDTKYSHFAGTPEQLMQRTLFAWHNACYRQSMLPGVRDTYIVSVQPQNFFAKQGACLIRDRSDHSPEPKWEKKDAGRAEVIVRIRQRSPTGAVEKLEIIDLQAYPVESSTKKSGEQRPSVQR